MEEWFYARKEKRILPVPLFRKKKKNCLNYLETNRLGFFGKYHSNSEAGDGYADITFSDAYSEKAVIIEIKSTKNVPELIDLSEAAVLQIEDKHYSDHYLENKMVQTIYAYGIAFSGKNCVVSCKKIK